MLGPGKQDHPRRVQQRRQQQVLEPPGVQQPDRIHQGGAGNHQVLAPRSRMPFIRFPTYRQQHCIGRRPQVWHQNHRRRQVDQAGVGPGGKQRDQQEQLNHHVGQPQGIGRHVVGVFPGQKARHGLVAGRGKENLGAQQGP
ncbi:hypothetical protein D3C78_802280 [compost metagenome]